MFPMLNIAVYVVKENGNTIERVERSAVRGREESGSREGTRGFLG